MKTLRPQTKTHTWTPLVLRPLQEKVNYILRVFLVLLEMMFITIMSWNGAPPLIYIEGSHPLLDHEMSKFSLEPTLGANEKLPRRSSKAVGPMGHQPTRVVGWPWAGPTSLPLLVEMLTSGPSCPWMLTWPHLCQFAPLMGSPIHVMLMWRRPIGWRLAPWLKRVWLPFIFS